MPSPTALNLLRRTTTRLTFIRSKSSAARKKKTKTSSSSSSDDAALKKYVSSLKSSSSSPSSSSSAVNKKAQQLLKNFKAPPSSNPTSSLHSLFRGRLQSRRRDDDGESAERLSAHASSLLYDELDLDWDEEYEDEQPEGDVLDLSWLLRMSNSNTSLLRKGPSREKKQKWVFKNTQSGRFNRLVKMCARKLGSDATIVIFGKLGQDTGLKEYNALIRICIEKARNNTDEDVSVEQLFKAYQIFKVLKEKGFKIEEETYGQFLMYLIDCGMVEEFFFFHEVIKDDNPDSIERLAYYEMLLFVRVNDEVKIQELCSSVVGDGAEEKSRLRESYLEALCESDRKEEFLMLLKHLDITQVTSVACLENVFRSLGKFLLEPLAERCFLSLKRSDIAAERISNCIMEYATSIPNLAVEDIIVKFRTLHDKFELLPTSAQYVKLIGYCCELYKVHEALNVVDGALESGVALSLEAFHSILDACDRSCEFNLVHEVNSRISQHNLQPNHETFRRMIQLFVKMKDFDGAYELINVFRRMDMTPTASMYNSILSGYFREKNIMSAMEVLKQMDEAAVKPDSMTYSFLIGNSRSEKDIIKFYDEMNKSGVPPTKHVFMSLINAYASCGNFEKAKQVILDKKIPVKSLAEIKSALVGALASNGQISTALEIYEEIKKAQCDLDPKAIKSLIEHFQSEGELNKSLELLEELNDSPYWTDACFRVLSYCVGQKNLRPIIDLLKQLKDKFINTDIAPEVLFDEVFCSFAEKESTDMEFGLSLLKAVKAELGVRPSRKSLDFLLSACVNAKDSKACFLIWKEYESAGLPYNVLSFVRMYQALLASGDIKSAKEILKKTRLDDPHVRSVIKASEETFMVSVEKKKLKKKKRALLATVGLLAGLEAKTK